MEEEDEQGITHRNIMLKHSLYKSYTYRCFMCPYKLLILDSRNYIVEFYFSTICIHVQWQNATICVFMTLD